ncbi:MAG: hypothetical protein AAB733_03255 [Patescibacteria group bacterium]
MRDWIALNASQDSNLAAFGIVLAGLGVVAILGGLGIAAMIQSVWRWRKRSWNPFSGS